MNYQEKDKFELFDSTLPRFPVMQVFGFGDIGKYVIDACEAHHLDGLKYELLDCGESKATSYQRVIKEADLSFIVVSTQDLTGLQQAALIASSIADVNGAIVLVLSGCLDENKENQDLLGALMQHSMTVVDFSDDGAGRLLHDLSVSNQYRTIEMLTQPIVGHGLIGMDIADIKLLLSKSPYMRCASVLVDVKAEHGLQTMLEHIYDVDEEKLSASLVSLSGRGVLDMYELMFKFGNDVSQASLNNAMQLFSQVFCADVKQSTHLSLLVAVESKSRMQPLCRSL